jgi:hypothetical protein
MWSRWLMGACMHVHAVTLVDGRMHACMSMWSHWLMGAARRLSLLCLFLNHGCTCLIMPLTNQERQRAQLQLGYTPASARLHSHQHMYGHMHSHVPEQMPSQPRAMHQTPNRCPAGYSQTHNDSDPGDFRTMRYSQHAVGPLGLRRPQNAAVSKCSILSTS